MERDWIKRAVVFTFIFTALSSLYLCFVLDDAFITFRYSANWAAGHGIVWNPGEDPVEGFTSFSWMALLALGIKCGVDPVIFAKVLSFLAALAVIWLMSYHTRRTPAVIAWGLTGALAGSPAFAFLSMQGLETGLMCLLYLVGAWLALRVNRRNTFTDSLLLNLVIVAAVMTRPDAAVFFLGVIWALVLSLGVYQRKGLGVLLLAGAPCLGLLLMFMAWRYQYFGYLFPNTFYIKMGLDSMIKEPGVKYLGNFLVLVLLPYLVFFLPRRFPQPESFPRGSWVLLPGFLLFALYICTIYPKQGYLHRFIFPLFPAFLLLLAFRFRQARVPLLERRLPRIVFLVWFLAWPWLSLPETMLNLTNSNPADRVAVGRTLAGLKGSLLTTESGALPYYSQWRTVDIRGLNSEQIAHHGFSDRVLEDLNPDLIMILQTDDHYNPPPETMRIIFRYMARHDFVGIAVVQKNQRQYHHYFARRSSPLFNELVDRLTAIPGLTYESPERVFGSEGVPYFLPDGKSKTEWRLPPAAL